MTILGVGTDIEDVRRFKNKPFKANKAFYSRIFTKREIDYCLKKDKPHQHFAARFCAKEAFIKAIDRKIADYRKVEILVDKSKPHIKYGKTKAQLSLSHEKDKALAFVVLS